MTDEQTGQAVDKTLERIVEFSSGLSFEDLSPEVVHECKRRIIDSLGCAVGGFTGVPSKIARAFASRTSSSMPARILGTLAPCAPELAAFANGVMIRYLDLNDATGLGGGHPSDMLGALLAAADASKTDGKTFITAMAAAYEIYLGFFSANQVRNSGIDHVLYTVTGAAAATARILNLDRRATANAISLALTPNLALGVTRRGQLSMWKGCAGGNACRNALFAAQLAADGMTGPGSVFEGDHGVFNAVGKFDWPVPHEGEGPCRILSTPIKMYPCIYPGQSPVTAALALHDEVNVDEIETVAVRTYYNAWWECASEPEMWAPATRETADHSIPYLVSVALTDGRIDVGSFSEERRADARLRALIRKVEVIHDKTLDALTPENDPCRIAVTVRGGATLTGSVDYPKGHFKNRASDKDVEQKLARMTAGLLSDAQVTNLLELGWRFEQLRDVGELISVVAI